MVSAIITTYKRPPEIVKRAAKSVLNQTYKDIELIIVDDSPETYEQRNEVCAMALSLGERVKYIKHEENLGACAARNTGIKNSNGEYIAFLDDDDEWLPEKIEKQLCVMKKNNSVALVYCGRYIYHEQNNILKCQKVEFHRGKIYDKLILNNFIGSTSFPLLRKSAIEKLGGFDVQMPAAQDFELWLRVAKAYEIDYVETPLVRYYVHNGDLITKNHTKKREALERLNELNMDYLIKHPKAHSVRILRTITHYIESDLKKSKELFWKAVKIYPLPNKDLLKAVKRLFIKPMLKNRNKE